MEFYKKEWETMFIFNPVEFSEGNEEENDNKIVSVWDHPVAVHCSLHASMIHIYMWLITTALYCFSIRLPLPLLRSAVVRTRHLDFRDFAVLLDHILPASKCMELHVRLIYFEFLTLVH